MRVNSRYIFSLFFCNSLKLSTQSRSNHLEKIKQKEIITVFFFWNWFFFCSTWGAGYQGKLHIGWCDLVTIKRFDNSLEDKKLERWILAGKIYSCYYFFYSTIFVFFFFWMVPPLKKKKKKNSPYTHTQSKKQLNFVFHKRFFLASCQYIFQSLPRNYWHCIFNTGAIDNEDTFPDKMKKNARF